MGLSSWPSRSLESVPHDSPLSPGLISWWFATFSAPTGLAGRRSRASSCPLPTERGGRPACGYAWSTAGSFPRPFTHRTASTPAVGLPGRLSRNLTGFCSRTPVTLMCLNQMASSVQTSSNGRKLSRQQQPWPCYTVTEALTNAAKHAHATTADIRVTADDRSLYLRIRDNGRGGVGLHPWNRPARAQGPGRSARRPPPVAQSSWCGTTLDVTLPLDDHSGPTLPPGAADVPEQTASA